MPRAMSSWRGGARGLQAGSTGKAFTDGEVKGGCGLWGRNERAPTEARGGEENGRGGLGSEPHPVVLSGKVTSTLTHSDST